LGLLLAWLLTSPANAGYFGPWLEAAPEEVAAEQDTAADTLVDVAPPPCSSVLVHGVQLPEIPSLFLRWSADRSYGEQYLVDTLLYAAEEMRWRSPDVEPITIGDMSARYGGTLDGHKTHNSGIDADVGLYLYDGRQATRAGFIEATPQTLDLEHTWQLVKIFLDTDRIDFILLDQRLIDALQDYVVANELLSSEELARVFLPATTPRPWEHHGYLRNASGHKNHMHVRVMCTGARALAASEG
jgi:murein endopeptidase